MLEQFKQELLRTKEIASLIYSGIVELIIVGGSRILSLESSSSDYDVVVFVKPSGTQISWTDIQLTSFNKVHYRTVSIRNMLLDMTNYDTAIDYRHYYNLLHLTLSTLKTDYIIYSSKSIETFLASIRYNAKALIGISLEKLLYTCRSSLISARPLKVYSKTIYHFLSFYYLLNNYIKMDLLGYTQEQTNTLLDVKISKTIPTGFIDTLKVSNIIGLGTLKYYYQPIWEELKQAYERNNYFN